jgi:DNA modification methylase
MSKPVSNPELKLGPDLRAPKLVWGQKAEAEEVESISAILRDIYGHGEELGKLFTGDSLETLRWLLANGYRESVDLVYIDPPFGGGALYSRKIHLRGPDAGTSFTAPAYQDFWSDAEYLQFMYERLVLLKELITDSGSFYLHVDTSQAHYLKVMCDEIFGRENFQREIVWRIGWVSGYKTQAKNWIRNHDTILFYTKNPDDFYFAKQYAPYSPSYRRRDGARPKGKGHPIEDTWNCSDQDRLDSIQIKSFSHEKTGYPTQKNEKLLERIIGASSPEGGLVLDCFGGSGTTATVAHAMSRRWISCDVNPEAVHTARARLLRTGAGQLSSGFSIYGFGEREQPEDIFADVSIKRTEQDVRINVVDFRSYAVNAKLKKPINDWRSIVECVLIDLNHDGEVFRIDFADCPADKKKTVRKEYSPKTSGRVAVKLIDVLGNEVVVKEPQ